MMHMSARGRADLKADEGEVLRAYRDIVGVWTIGVGLTAASGVVKPHAGMVITAEESDRLLTLALERNYEPRVNRALGPVKQNEFDGATSFDFNTGAIDRATWVTRFKAGLMASAEASFKQWDKAKGKVVLGLTLRRAREWETIEHGKYHTRPTEPRPGLSRALRRGSKGEDVEDLQRLLSKAGHPVKVDGDFGPATEAAVRAVQTAHPHLTVDGIAGRATMDTLRRMAAAKSKAVTTAGGAAAGTGAAGAGSEAIDAGATVPLELILAIGGGIAVLILLLHAWRYRDEIRAYFRRT